MTAHRIPALRQNTISDQHFIQMINILLTFQIIHLIDMIYLGDSHFTLQIDEINPMPKRQLIKQPWNILFYKIK